MSKAVAPTGLALARIIVEGILDTIERAGRFEGRGKDRRLILMQGFDFKTGETFDITDRMVEWTNRLIVGPPPTIGRADAEGAARDPQGVSGPVS